MYVYEYFPVLSTILKNITSIIKFSQLKIKIASSVNRKAARAEQRSASTLELVAQTLLLTVLTHALTDFYFMEFLSDPVAVVSFVVLLE